MRAAKLLVSAALGLGLWLELGAGAFGGRLAHAQQLELSDAERRSFRSTQHFGFSLHFGPYRPEIDSEFPSKVDAEGHNLQRWPYRDVFGNGSKLMTQASFEYQFLRSFGTLAAGIDAGYFSVTAKAIKADGTADRSNDDTRLRLVPLAASLIYRLSVTNDRYGIPVIPYAKAGLDYVIWAVNNGNGDIVSDHEGGKARGGTLGWHGTLGVSLVLDFLDPDAAHEFDADTGVNHTHLFFEFTKASVNGLWQSNRLRVGDTTWNMGLLFEF